MTEGYDNSPCPDCGATGSHPEWGAHYWPCGSMKCASIRGEMCYEAELAALKARLAEAEGFLRRCSYAFNAMRLADKCYLLYGEPDSVEQIKNDLKTFITPTIPQEAP